MFAKIAADRVLRRQIAYESHQLFFAMYFPDYLKYPVAQFQKDIIRLTEDKRRKLVCIAGFRGCGKSTLVSLSYALWSILGVQNKKFVLIICQTQSKARNTMANIKTALENNRLLKSDMGPFREESGGEWALSSLVFRNSGARIMIASVDQSVRGVRHREHRPDIIVLDDVEDINSVRSFESRSKMAEWYSREITPLGDIGTRIFILANVLHYDSLIMRLKRKIDDDEMDGVYRFFPLLDERGACLWPDKFDAPAKIEALRRSIGDEAAWRQEFLLQVMSDASRGINPNWIQYYDTLPPLSTTTSERHFAAIDLAISKKDSADYTAIVQATVWYDERGNPVIYIMPDPVNAHMEFTDTIKCLKMIIPSLGNSGLLFIETTGFQEAYFQQLFADGYHNIESIKPLADKQMRLILTAPFVRDGIVLFPRRGCEQLIAQVTHPYTERHDDLADAFSMLVQQIMEGYNYVARLSRQEKSQPGIFKPWGLRRFTRDMTW